MNEPFDEIKDRELDKIFQMIKQKIKKLRWNLKTFEFTAPLSQAKLKIKA